MLKQLALATFAATAFVAATLSTANAVGCPTWICGSNGTQLTGIAGQTSDDSERFEGSRGGCDDWGCGSNGSSYQGVLLNGVALKQSVSGKHGVNTVILPTGEIVNLR